MYTSTALVPTERATRYRDQLASHGAGMLRMHLGAAGHRRPPVLGTEAVEDVVVLRLTWGSCTITATDVGLGLTAEADTLDDLAKIQSGVAGRITKIGRREKLSVTWSAPEDSPSGS